MKPHKNRADLKNKSICGYPKRKHAYLHETVYTESAWPALVHSLYQSGTWWIPCRLLLISTERHIVLSCQNIDRAGGACISQGDQSHHNNGDAQEKVAVVDEVDGEEKGVEDGADDQREKVDFSCIMTSHLPAKQQTKDYLNIQDKGE